MYFAYVLKSIDHDYYYKGHCKDIEKRLAEHNSGMTTSNRPYILQKRLPKSKLNILENIGHYTWEESWQDFLAISLQWMNQAYLRIGYLKKEIKEADGI